MIRNQLYPYIEKYINDYLYGFTKEQMNLAITQGKLELNSINLRPDAINKIMNENNIPFWIKAGLINKIYVGCSLMNIIGEIPLEATIEGIDIILSPSYKWINENLEIIRGISEYIKENPIGLDLNDNDNLSKKFDTSIFNKSNIEEIFKDKTIISNLANSLLKSLYDFYNMTNYAVILKINKFRIRIEDDELFNYEGKFVLGIKIENIICKMGFKGSQKKNSLKIENFSVFWENQPQIIIKNEFLNKSMILGKIGADYYDQIKSINFNIINDNYKNFNIKLIIDNFSMTINFGTKNKEKGTADIFNIQDNLKKTYFQISSNELIINIYPEFLKVINHFSSFSSNFSVIEKIKKYRPNKRPYDINKNEATLNNKTKKEIVKNWLHYFIWKNKIQKKSDVLSENPFRAEFNRFYNIYHKRVDVYELLEKIKEKEKEKEKENGNKEESKENNNIDNNKDNNENEISGLYEEIYTFDKYVKKYRRDKDSDKTKEDYEKYLDKKLKKKYSDFSSTIEMLIKGFIINLHPSLNRNIDINNNIVINFSGIDIKIGISPEQFNFNLGLQTIDIGTRELIYGERVILCPTSYRTNLLNQDKGIYNSNIIITPTDNNINTIHEQQKREAGLTGLIKKFNPNHEEKIKIIDDALSKIGDEPKNIKNFYYEYNTNNKTTTLRNRPNILLNSNATVNGFNKINNLRKSYVTKIGESNYYSGKPRNSSFAKTIIENFNETDLRLKQKLNKQKNELNISQAINNYNTNNSNKRNNTPLNNGRNTSVSNLMNSYSTIKLKSKNKFIFKDNNTNTNTKNNNSPLGFLEIYSNSKIGELKLKYIKYNNSFSLDDFSIQVGTIRLHPFFQYITEMITIFLDYQKSQNKPQIKTSQIKSVDGGGMDGTKNLLKMRQQFYEILSELPDNEKTKTIKDYINYLENENDKLLKFNKDIDIKPFFEINYLFSFFPKGIKFYFDYENIECVYYNKVHKVLGKFMISPYTINISISLSKIIANFFGINIEINNLMESKTFIEKLMDKCQKMLNDKKDLIQIIIEPCYEAIKDELVNEGLFDGDIYKNININNIQKSIKKSINKLPIVNKK